ncbi:Pentatricopeptide repeat-containing protein [Thalictrum thalictroides]|uniref:Pentatricopeptide repeat-containing protein n=1 Tax=Thalictrum thalictroides TaxID=46969 RepID=A0A7J6X3Y9_THATH|nr:Pentatricopeptide repeat-containing protein [Thalictrum thalictroides]
MDGLCKNDRFAEAIELYNLLEKNGLEANIVIYNIILDGMCKTRKLFEAKELFYNLSTKDLQPDTRTYNIMIKGHCKEGMLGDAQELFHEMEDKNVAPDDFTFNILVLGFLLQGNDTDKAMHILRTMIERGFSPFAETLSELFNLHSTGGPNYEHIKTFLNLFPEG